MAQISDDPQKAMRKVALRVGQLITIAALGFLIWELYRQWGNVNDWRPSMGTILLLVGLAVGYPAVLMVLAHNWVAILRAVLDEPVPKKEGLLSFTKTQIAKYVPGNVLHYVGRHFYLKHLGFAHKPVAFAALLEIVSQLVAAVVAIGLAIALIGSGEFGDWGQGQLLVILLTLVLALGCGALIAIWRGQRRMIGPATIVVIRATLFMLLQGLIFAIVLYATSGSFVALAVPVAIFAWLVGFVTPGAPGGVAVREVMIVNLLGAAAPSQDVLIAALLFRVITVVGDLGLYLYGNAVIARRTSEA